MRIKELELGVCERMAAGIQIHIMTMASRWIEIPHNLDTLGIDHIKKLGFKRTAIQDSRRHSPLHPSHGVYRSNRPCRQLS